MYYTLEEISVLIEKKVHELNEETNSILELLKNEVASYVVINDDKPNKKYIEKTMEQKSRYKKGVPTMKEEALEGRWDKQPVFKPMKKEEKVGIEKNVDDIRILLNKISDKNYETNKEAIIKKIRECLEENEENSNDIKRVVTVLFEIAKSNKFYSEIYAKLYKELIDNFPFFNEMIEPFINQFMESLNKLVYVDSSKDYDGFCNYNKMNENRRASMAFIVNLMKNNVDISMDILDIVKHFQELAIKYIEEENRVNEVDEITEVLNIVIIMIYEKYKKEEKWLEEIEPKIKMFSMYKIKEKPSLSSRSIFKYKDIYDKMK